jgi:peptidoglycan/LPS O-acetylase OafA/YrhL
MSVPQRLPEIDALRGIAAFAVVLFHFNSQLHVELTRQLPPAFGDAFSLGYLGVTMFFVLSGFVISLSISPHNVNAAYMRRFALRRSLRLDPPYLTSIAVVLAMTSVKNFLYPEHHSEFPTYYQLGAHVLYLQNVLGFGDILPVYWTLCFEIQFYLLLLFVIFLMQNTTRDRTTAAALKNSATCIVFVGTALLSASIYAGIIPNPQHGLALSHWCFFCLGVVSYWTRTEHIKRQYLWLLSFGLALVTAKLGHKWPTVVAALTTSTFLSMNSIPLAITRLLSASLFQYLGKISYSLYLFHGIFGWTLVSLLKQHRLHPETPPGITWTITALVCGIGFSIAVSHLAYLLIEKPSTKFSRAISLDH